MYQRDQAKISQYARKNAEQFARVMQFVILTTRVKLVRVPGDFETADQGGDDAMSVLFGWKFKAFTEAWINREQHFTYCEHVMSSGDDREQTRILIEYIA